MSYCRNFLWYIFYLSYDIWPQTMVLKSNYKCIKGFSDNEDQRFYISTGILHICQNVLKNLRVVKCALVLKMWLCCIGVWLNASQYLPFCPSLQWRHNECDGVSKHQPHECLLSRLFRRRSKKTSKLRVTGLCEGNSPVTGEFPSQRASNADDVFIWWRHHDGDRCWLSKAFHSVWNW